MDDIKRTHNNKFEHKHADYNYWHSIKRVHADNEQNELYWNIRSSSERCRYRDINGLCNIATTVLRCSKEHCMVAL